MTTVSHPLMRYRSRLIDAFVGRRRLPSQAKFPASLYTREAGISPPARPPFLRRLTDKLSAVTRWRKINHLCLINRLFILRPMIDDDRLWSWYFTDNPQQPQSNRSSVYAAKWLNTYCNFAQRVLDNHLRVYARLGLPDHWYEVVIFAGVAWLSQKRVVLRFTNEIIQTLLHLAANGQSDPRLSSLSAESGSVTRLSGKLEMSLIRQIRSLRETTHNWITRQSLATATTTSIVASSVFASIDNNWLIDWHLTTVSALTGYMPIVPLKTMSHVVKNLH